MTTIRDVPIEALPTVPPETCHDLGMQAARWLGAHFTAPPPPVAGWPEVYSLTTEPEIHRAYSRALEHVRDTCGPTDRDTAARRYAEALERQWLASINGGRDMPYVSPERIARAEAYRDAALERWSSSLAGPPPAATEDGAA